jgi:hypothetical protein
MRLIAQLPDHLVEDIFKKYSELIEAFTAYCETNGVSRSLLSLIPKKDE